MAMLDKKIDMKDLWKAKRTFICGRNENKGEKKGKNEEENWKMRGKKRMFFRKIGKKEKRMDF